MSYLCPKTRSRDMSRTNIVFLAGHVSGVAPLIVSNGADSVAVQQTTAMVLVVWQYNKLHTAGSPLFAF